MSEVIDIRNVTSETELFDVIEDAVQNAEYSDSEFHAQASLTWRDDNWPGDYQVLAVNSNGRVGIRLDTES